MSVNGTLVEAKMRRFKGECAHDCFNKCPIYAHDGASAKFSTNSHETDNSVKSCLRYLAGEGERVEQIKTTAISVQGVSSTIFPLRPVYT